MVLELATFRLMQEAIRELLLNGNGLKFTKLPFRLGLSWSYKTDGLLRNKLEMAGNHIAGFNYMPDAADADWKNYYLDIMHTCDYPIFSFSDAACSSTSCSEERCALLNEKLRNSREFGTLVEFLCVRIDDKEHKNRLSLLVCCLQVDSNLLFFSKQYAEFDASGIPQIRYERLHFEPPGNDFSIDLYNDFPNGPSLGPSLVSSIHPRKSSSAPASSTLTTEIDKQLMGGEIRWRDPDTEQVKEIDIKGSQKQKTEKDRDTSTSKKGMRKHKGGRGCSIQ